MVTTEGIKL